jgi:DNA-binding NarL/FixJ family response regulator
MKVILTDDHKVVRDGLRWMLSGEEDVEVVGEAASGEQLLDLLSATTADVVLLDVRMPGMGGLDALAEIARRVPEVKVIILSMHDEPAYVRRAIELGAAGYLLKNANREEILEALRAVHAGRAYVQNDLTGTLLSTISGKERSVLSPRELEILSLVSQGLENKQIATALGISEATVKTHLKGVFTRLEVSSRAEAVATGLRLGLIE